MAFSSSIFMLRIAARYSAIICVFWIFRTTTASVEPRLNPVVKMALMHQVVPMLDNGEVVDNKTAYYGHLYLGTNENQKLTVIIDTGSGNLFVPSVFCEDEACLTRRRYDPGLSSSVAGLTLRGNEVPRPTAIRRRDIVEIQYGTGVMSGDLIMETICFSSDIANETLSAKVAIDDSGDDGEVRDSCTRMGLISARHLSRQPFLQFSFDGVLGLGLPALSVRPSMNFVKQMSQELAMDPIFGLFISKVANRSEIHFGGHDKTRYHGHLQFVPVIDPEHGHWRVRINRVFIGSKAVPSCEDGKCSAILDSGSSFLGVPRKLVYDFFWETKHILTQPEKGQELFDCRGIPNVPITFEMPNFTIRMDRKDYVRVRPKNVTATDNKTEMMCLGRFKAFAIGNYDLDFIWGAPMLRNYYTSFNSGTHEIGFAPSREPEDIIEV